MPQLFTLPAIRRSTFRAPDPAAIAAAAAPELADAPSRTDALEPVAPAATDDAVTSEAAEAAATAEAAAATDAAAEHRADQRGARARDVRREPRHRADRVGNRRPSSGARRIVALGCATAILGGSAFGAVAASAKGHDGTSIVADRIGGGGTADAATAASADELVSRIGDDPEPVVTSALSTAAVPFTGGTEVTVEGELLDEVAAVTVGGVPAAIVSATPASVTFTVPAVDDETRGDVPVAFTDAAGEPIDVEVPVASSPAVAASAPVAPAFTDAAASATGTGAAPGPTVDALSLTYTDDERINAQVGYVLAHWNNYNTAEYTVLSGVDCANFTSQSLVARGWQMDAAWYYDRATGAMGAAWSSSTAMRDWLLSRPDLASPLDDAQRDAVKVGDIAQFDWDRSGDRDHTTVVTRVEHTATGTKVWVGGHTKDSDYWDVDEALASSGGAVSYFSLS